jgi:pyruvate,orthophosphate dikinase
MSHRWVYDFADGSRDMRELLGGKGAGVAEMTRVLGSERVPAGFTVTTEACVEYMRAGQREPEGMAEQVAEALQRLERHAGKRLGDAQDPLLVSVRSGARESMPGMLDTVLNLGLNDESVRGLAATTDNERFAWDSYRRFVQMFGNVSRGIPGERFEDAIADAKRERGVRLDTDLDTEALKNLTQTFKDIYREATGDEFPQDPTEQLRLAIRAVFDSWTGERAVEYRRINRIPDEWGTAVNVQQMVFGNKGETSGSGVAFSRCCSTRSRATSRASGSRTPWRPVERRWRSRLKWTIRSVTGARWSRWRGRSGRWSAWPRRRRPWSRRSQCWSRPGRSRRSLGPTALCCGWRPQRSIPAS